MEIIETILTVIGGITVALGIATAVMIKYYKIDPIDDDEEVLP